MSEVSALAKAFQDYGPWALVAVLLIAVVALWRHANEIQAQRLCDLKDMLATGIRAQEAAAHALDKLEDVVRSNKS